MSDGQRTVLVVDDDEATRQFLAGRLEAGGFRVVTARDGEEALQLASAERPALVVTDLHMPRLDGFGLIVGLRENPDLVDMPIIIVTASFDQDEIMARLALPEGMGFLLSGVTILHKPVDGAHLLRQVESALDSKPNSRLPVLVVDDDQANLEMIERRLEVEDFETVLVETGEAALNQVKAREFQAILLDLRLPDMSGLDVLAIVKKSHPGLPVLIMTAHGSESLAVKTLTEGAADYLIKPVSRRELTSALRSAIDRYALQQENRRIQKNLIEAVMALKQSLRNTEMTKNRLEALMDTMDEGVLVMDHEGQVERMNAEAVRLLDLGVRPRNMTEVWQGLLSVVDEQGNPLPRTLPTPDAEVQGLEVLVTLASGNKKSFLVSSRSLADGSGRMVLFRDVTARRVRREKLESLLTDLSSELESAHQQRIQEVQAASAQAERLKADILSAVSHELRTPLNFIVGFGSVLADGVAGELTPEQCRLVDKMLHGAERLSGTVEDLLSFAMLTSDMLTPRLEPVALGPLVREAADAEAQDARDRGITLAVELIGGDDAFETPGPTTDLGFVRNIVRQLVSNAIKFTPEGGRVTLRVGQADGAYEIAVIDTGIGIAPEAQARLFDHFFQVESDLTRRFGGTGLGLALVKGLSALIGATVTVESEVGRGSVFHLTLPAQPPQS